VRLFLIALAISIGIHFISFYQIEVEPPKKIEQSNSKKTKPKGSQVKFVKLAPKKIEKPKPIVKKQSKPKPIQKNIKEYKKVEKKDIKPQEPKPVKKAVEKIKAPKLEKKSVQPNYTPPPNEKPKEIKKPFNLNDFLNATQPEKKKDKIDEVTKSYIKLYGDEFNSFSDETKKFLKDSLKDIGKITQRYLEYPYLAAYGGQSGTNVVMFYLHPDGTITDMKIISSSGYNILDWNTKDTIEKAYKDYPRPKEKAKIIIYVNYRLY
jgi:protein TonB